MDKRIMIAVGGTGGHVYPAMALAEQLIPSKRVLFIGGGLAENRYFNRQVFDYQSIACGSFVKKNPLAILQSGRAIGYGVWQSLRMIRDFKPDLLVGFGSYHSFPPLLAAKIASIPFILHASDCIPGKVIRLFSRHALATGIQFPSSAAFLKGKPKEVRMPLRMSYKPSREGKGQARDYFNLSSELETVLVFGGSQGAQAINRLFSEAILERKPTLQVLHFTGEPAMAEQLKQLYRRHRIQACVKAFETEMHLAWQTADIVISRAGAVTMAEQLEFEVPGILIPYPLAADNHQELNADFLVSTIGGGIKCLERDLTPTILAQEIETLLTKKTVMRQAMSDYKKKSDTCSLVELIEQALSGSL